MGYTACMALEPDQLLQRAVESGALNEQKGQAALAVYSRLQEMGAEFTFGEFLVERGLLPQMAVDAFESESGESFSAVDTLGDFTLTELLGEGENGAVYRAVQNSLERDVALKILNTEIAQDEAAVERFLREARAVAKLNHPHVVHGYSAGSEHGLHYFAMELLEGGSARDLITDSESGHLTERRALEIVAQAAEGLKAAHAAGILHRDVKPDNILLTRDGIAKLTDLGIAQIVYAKADGGTFWGSPPYVAPETVKGTATNDARSDIYSLGATLFELLIGTPPFMAEDPEEILRMHLDEAPQDVRALRPELNPRTATLVRLMLAKEPNERLLSADVVVKAIARIMQDLNAVAAAPAQPHVALPKPVALKPRVVMRSPVRIDLHGKKPPLKKAVPGRVVRPLQRPATAHTATPKKVVAVQPRLPARPVPGRSVVLARPAVPIKGRRPK